MKFATLSHLLTEKNKEQLPKEWFQDDLFITPEMNISGVKGQIIALTMTAEQIMKLPRNEVKNKILSAMIYAQDELDINLIQLGALTTSVTDGGTWIIKQKKYAGYVNHGDSYTAAVTCQAVYKILKNLQKTPENLSLSIVGAYGIIGTAISKILVPEFSHTKLIGRKINKFNKLTEELDGNYSISADLKTKKADVVITCTNHPSALLNSEHLKRNAIIVDVSQPPNVSHDLCIKRPDIIRIDGGFVNFPDKHYIPLPGVPKGKQFACFVEVIMQALENEQKNHVGPIDLKHLRKTEKWANKYCFKLNELTNFGKPFGI